MACKILLNRISDNDKYYLGTTLQCDNNDCFLMDDDYVYIPYSFCRETFDNTGKIFPTIDDSVSSFKGQLREEQKEIIKSAKKLLNDTGSVLISAYPGFGKTISSINICCSINLPTLIVVNKIILIEQWKESILKFSTGEKCQYITPSTKKLDNKVNFYIVNAINISKFSREFWSSIKVLVVDELHQIITKVLSKSLFLIEPYFIIGLSATPYRFDEYNNCIKWFFGKNELNIKLQKSHTVYTIETGFIPEIKYTNQGIDWNCVLESQASNEERNIKIVNSILNHLDRTWMILVKRVSHADELIKLFNDKDIVCETLLRSKQTFDKNCKILIGTTSKIGVGFDHSAINALCVAADVKNYFVQFLGRCMRRVDVSPIVLDFLDNFGPLRSHYLSRIKEYKDHGGTIMPLTVE